MLRLGTCVGVDVPLIVGVAELVQVSDPVTVEVFDGTCDRDGDNDALADGLGVVESEPLRVRVPVSDDVGVTEAVPELVAVDDDVAA